METYCKKPKRLIRYLKDLNQIKSKSNKNKATHPLLRIGVFSAMHGNNCELTKHKATSHCHISRRAAKVVHCSKNNTKFYGILKASYSVGIHFITQVCITDKSLQVNPRLGQSQCATPINYCCQSVIKQSWVSSEATALEASLPGGFSMRMQGSKV